MTRPTMRSTILGSLALAGLGLLAGCSDDDDVGAAATGGSAGSSGSGGSGGMAGSGGSAGSGGMAGSGGVAGAGGMAGAGGSDAGAPARLRVVHASANAPAVDIYAKGASTAAVTNFAYGEATSYLELPAGTFAVDLRAAGAAASSAPAFTSPDLTLEAGRSYVAIAAGSFGSSSPDDQFRVLALEEDFDAAASGSFRARVVHASYDAPTVDIDVGDDGSSEITGLARFTDTPAAGVDLPAATALSVAIRAGSARVTGFTTPTVIPAAANVLLIAVGELGALPRQERGFSLLAVLPASTTDSPTATVKQDPVVYALHASPDAPAVDIYAGATELVDNAPYGAMARLQVPPGAYTLDFFAGVAGPTPRPAGAPAASATTPALAAGGSYLAAAVGQLGATPATFQLLPLEEGFDLGSAGSAVVRAVHASSNAPSVDIGTVTTAGTLDSPPLYAGVAFPDASAAAGAALTPGAVTLGFAAAGSTATAAEFDLTLTAGLRAFVLATGDFGGSSNGFGLMIVDTTSSPWTVAPVAPK